MSLEQLPDEIIQKLLYHVPPTDTLYSVQLLSRRLHQLSEVPLLWRHYCRTSFQHWHPRHRFQERISCKPANGHWKQLFIERHTCNRRIARLFDGILASKIGRLNKFEDICRLGYDAKDFLLQQCHTADTADDILARRHYGNAILDSIHRSIAIEQWSGMRSTQDDPATATDGSAPTITTSDLERGLGAFDMFVLHDQPGDLEEISHILDHRAAEFLLSQSNLEELTTRQKALALNRWLREKNLTGIRDQERNYRNLRNCLIGQALRHEDHDSIPIISSAIFCCMAERIGLKAQCCPYPSHVHVIVFPASGNTLDDEPVTGDEPPDRLYLDPFGRDEEVPVAALQEFLVRLGWQTSTAELLAPVSASAVVLRTANNIRATFARMLELQDQAHPDISALLRGNDAVNIDASQYASIWASLMLTRANTFEWEDRVAGLLRQFASSWPEDAWLVEKYLWAKYKNVNRDMDGPRRYHGSRDPWEYLRAVREKDFVETPVIRRDVAANEAVPFKIGQVFRHRRYGWIGVITGWSDQGNAHALPGNEGSDTESADKPPRRARPPKQFYFMCFPSTGSEPHKVAADNIELIHNASEVSDGMFPLAGKFFKRFDPASCTFVSNIKEQYPDD